VPVAPPAPPPLVVAPAPPPVEAPGLGLLGVSSPHEPSAANVSAKEDTRRIEVDFMTGLPCRKCKLSRGTFIKRPKYITSARRTVPACYMLVTVTLMIDGATA
jgi:hypothetical protein